MEVCSNLGRRLDLNGHWTNSECTEDTVKVIPRIGISICAKLGATIIYSLWEADRNVSALEERLSESHPQLFLWRNPSISNF